MVVFSQDDAKIIVSKHAAVRWMERVHSSLTIEEAQKVVAEGLTENGRLLAEHKHSVDGRTLLYEWNGLVFPLIPKENYAGEKLWLAKTTLLKGMR